MKQVQVVYSDTGTGGLLCLWYKWSTGSLVQVVYRDIGTGGLQ